jgi:hypothetical protein
VLPTGATDLSDSRVLPAAHAAAAHAISIGMNPRRLRGPIARHRNDGRDDRNRKQAADY